MKRFLVMLMVALFSAALIVPDAEARRMGGGRSIGKQTDMPKRQATPSQAAPAAGAAAGAAAAGGRSWMGPLAGIAAGLGLAALASWMGFGEEFATMMMLMLVAMVAFIAFRMFMARRQGGSLAGAGAGGAAGGAGRFDQAMQRQSLAPGAGQNGMAGGAAGGAAGAASAAAAASLIPADFDADGFVRNAKVFFVRLQAAFDKKDLDDLREFTSPEMFGELKVEILQRGDEGQTTDVVKLDGRLIGVDRDPALELASVQFSGMMREAADAAAEPFEEIWNFSRPVNGGAGWVLAGIQQIR